MARKNRKVSIPHVPSFAFVVDGETERWYIHMLKRNAPSLRVVMKPEIPDKKALKEQFDKVKELSKTSYDRVFWIIDIDTVEKKGQVAKLKELCAQAKRLNKVTVIINNPCFEYWHLLHFRQTSKYYKTFDALKKDLMVFLPDYDKSQKYYTKEHQDIFLRPRGNLRTAIKNARLLPDFDFDHPHRGLSEMYLIFEEEMDGVKIIDMIDAV